MPVDERDHHTPLSEADVIRELLGRNATFVAFRLPGIETSVRIQRDPVLQGPRKGERDFVIAPFTGDAVCIRPDIEFSVASAPSMLEELSSRNDASSTQPLVQGLDRAGYRFAVERAIDAIKQGPVKKVVLARTIDADLANIDLGTLFSAASRAMPHAFVALVHTAEHGTWLGASPERLVIVQGDRIEVDALAGTMPSATAPSEAAAWGAKEREEQELVTRSVLRTMRERGVADATTDGPAVVKAGSIAHLRTLVNGRLTQADPLALAAALHPTPAVGGTPKAEAIELIHALEPRDRSLYAGYWGPMAQGGAELFVNIRCMHVIGTTGFLYVGAGITSGSDPDRECDEVEQKARTWLDLIETQRRAG